MNATATNIKTSSDLRYAVEEAGHAPAFFTRDSMRFFGDTMRNYGVRRVTVTTIMGDAPTEAYELYRRQPVRNGMDASAFFCAHSFRRLHGCKII